MKYLKLKSDEKKFLLAVIWFVVLIFTAHLFAQYLPDPLNLTLFMCLLVYLAFILVMLVYFIARFLREWYRSAEFHNKGRLGSLLSWLKRDDR